MKSVLLDTLFRALMLITNLLALWVALSVLPNVPALAPIIHSPDQQTVLLGWVVLMAATFLAFNLVALGLYRFLRGIIGGDEEVYRESSNGRETSRDVQYRRQTGRRAKARPVNPSAPPIVGGANITPGFPVDLEDEIAHLFSALYPVNARVDNPRKGKINIKLYDAKGGLAGVVQVSPDNDAAVLGPDALRTLNAYKSKSGVSRAFFVSTGRFSEATIQ